MTTREEKETLFKALLADSYGRVVDDAVAEYRRECEASGRVITPTMLRNAIEARLQSYAGAGVLIPDVEVAKASMLAGGGFTVKLTAASNTVRDVARRKR